VWWNDPDPVYVRESMPLKHAQLICSWVALSGQLNLSSEWIPGLPAERLDILKRTMPSHQAVARPVDLFEHDLPRVWTVSAPDRTVVGLFNWESAEQSFDVPVERLGLDAKAELVAYDYWGNRFLPSIQGRIRLSVPGESCVVLAVRPRVNHPQLIGTSRHVTQGIVDVAEEKWDAASRTLSGRSRLVGQDACELRIVDGGAKVERVSVSDAGVKTSYSAGESLTRVKLEAATSREVLWSIQFK
jgi:hypothetical protein